MKPSAGASFIGAAKLESLGPEPPPNPFFNAEPNVLPLPKPPNADVVGPTNPKPKTGLGAAVSPIVVMVEVVLGDLELDRFPKPDVVV